MLRSSEKTTKIASAFGAARSVMEQPKFNRKNPHFKSEYADLGELLRVALPPLHNEGITLNMSASSDLDGVHVTVRLTDRESGEFYEDTLSLVPDKKTPQGYGSAITYARRYALESMLCLFAQSDDDGNAASPPPDNKYKVDNSQMQTNQHPMAKDVYLGSPSQKKLLSAIFKRYGVDSSDDMKKVHEHAVKNKMTMEDIETYLNGGM
jgi:hypothetical protein